MFHLLLSTLSIAMLENLLVFIKLYDTTLQKLMHVTIVISKVYDIMISKVCDIVASKVYDMISKVHNIVNQK